MEKELKVFKEGTGNHTLKDFKKVSGMHYEMEFNSDIELQTDDLIWATEDMVNGNNDNLLFVTKVLDDGKIITKPAEGYHLNEIREFNVGEVFKTVATFRVK